MFTRMRRIIFLIIWICLAPSALGANRDPGGDGVLHSTLLSGQCFKTASDTVTEVCATYNVRWKLWTLMGEPVGNYTLAWQLESIRLANPKRKQAITYTAGSLPAGLQKAAAAITLYIDGYATVNGRALFHQFDTGVDVRAGQTRSFNTPGSASWDKVFSQGYAACKERSQAPLYLDAKGAKAIFTQGVTLTDLHLCADSGVSELTALETAVAGLCGMPGADKKYAFCPTQESERPKTPQSSAANDMPQKNKKKDAIDDAFGRLDKSSSPKASAANGNNIDAAFGQMETDRAEQERTRIAAEKARRQQQAREQEQQARHDAAVKFCTGAIQDEQSCLRNGCGARQNETVCTDLRQDPPPPCDAPPGHSCLVFPHYTCFGQGPNPRFPEWKSCTQKLAKTCAPNGMRSQSLDECVKKREAAPR